MKVTFTCILTMMTGVDQQCFNSDLFFFELVPTFSLLLILLSAGRQVKLSWVHIWTIGSSRLPTPFREASFSRLDRWGLVPVHNHIKAKTGAVAKGIFLVYFYFNNLYLVFLVWLIALWTGQQTCKMSFVLQRRQILDTDFTPMLQTNLSGNRMQNLGQFLSIRQADSGQVGKFNWSA